MVFKTCVPYSAPVFRRLIASSFLHFPLWSKNCLDSVYYVFFNKCSTHWYTIFKISLWQTRYKALKGAVPPNLLNIEHMISWTSCQLPFLFWSILCVRACVCVFLTSLRLVEDQAMHYGQGHSIKQQKSTWVCFKGMSTIVNVCFQKIDSSLLLLNTHSPKKLFYFCL